MSRHLEFRFAKWRSTCRQVLPALRAPPTNIWWVWRSWLARQIVALEAVGSSPTIHPYEFPVNSMVCGEFCICKKVASQGQKLHQADSLSQNFPYFLIFASHFDRLVVVTCHHCSRVSGESLNLFFADPGIVHSRDVMKSDPM